MIPSRIRRPYPDCSRPSIMAANGSLTDAGILTSPCREGGIRQIGHGGRKVCRTSVVLSRNLAALSVAAAGLGLVACSTTGGRTSASTVPSPSHPATSASAEATHSAPIASAGTQPAPADAAPCADESSWGTDQQDGGTAMTLAALYLVRAGRHECYDRVVFDLNGPADVGYTARYVPVVRAEASGAPVPVKGRAALQVVVRGPIYGTDNQGHQPWRQPPAVGQDFIAPANVAGWGALAEVSFAGSFEGQTTFAVGVRGEHPFRIWTRSEQNDQHVILDIAHQDPL
jgi:hypothetical protein